MKQFELSFKFAGDQQVALVTEMLGEEANQYTLHPKDETLLQKYGSQIVHATQAAKQSPPEKWPALATYEPAPEEKFRADCLFIAAQSLAAGQGIDPALVASRQEIGEFYRIFLTGQIPENSRILRGWRRQAVGQTLLDLLHGKSRINLQWKDDHLRF